MKTSDYRDALLDYYDDISRRKRKFKDALEKIFPAMAKREDMDIGYVIEDIELPYQKIEYEGGNLLSLSLYHWNEEIPEGSLAFVGESNILIFISRRIASPILVKRGLTFGDDVKSIGGAEIRSKDIIGHDDLPNLIEITEYYFDDSLNEIEENKTSQYFETEYKSKKGNFALSLALRAQVDLIKHLTGDKSIKSNASVATREAWIEQKIREYGIASDVPELEYLYEHEPEIQSPYDEALDAIEIEE